MESKTKCQSKAKTTTGKSLLSPTADNLLASVRKSAGSSFVSSRSFLATKSNAHKRFVCIKRMESVPQRAENNRLAAKRKESLPNERQNLSLFQQKAMEKQRESRSMVTKGDPCSYQLNRDLNKRRLKNGCSLSGDLGCLPEGWPIMGGENAYSTKRKSPRHVVGPRE